MFVSTYQLLKMFRATMCPSSGADDLVVVGKYEAQLRCVSYFPTDTRAANRI